jgi:hypothetical protein
MKRGLRVLTVTVGLLLPAIGFAEVSVQLDKDGQFKKYFYLTRGEGHSNVVWGQQRGNLPLELMLNPLGDNLGDLAPRIAADPTTGYPWVVWSRNVANQKRIAWSTWNGERWTEPSLVVRLADPFGHDELDPQMSFDVMGRPFLTWSVEAPVSRIFVSLLVGGVWTSPRRVSDDAVDSRRPSAKHGTNYAAVTYDTPTGQLTRMISTVVLLDDAGIMDNPIPPGVQDDPGDNQVIWGGGSDDEFIKKR